MKVRPFYHCAVLFILVFACIANFSLYAEEEEEEGASDLILQTLARGMRYNDELVNDGDGVYTIDERVYDPMKKAWIGRTLKIHLSYSGERLLKEEHWDIWEGREIMLGEMPTAAMVDYSAEAYDGDYKVSLMKQENNIGTRASVKSKNSPFRARWHTPMGRARRLRGMYVPDILDGSAKSKVHYAVKLRGHETIHENECYAVEVKLGTVTYWHFIDSQRGYLPRRIESRSQNGNIRFERTFESKQYPGGIWYPDKVTGKTYFHTSDGTRKVFHDYTLKVRRFRFNIGLPKEHFRLAISPGTTVSDIDKKQSFKQPQYPLETSQIWKLLRAVKGNLSAIAKLDGQEAEVLAEEHETTEPKVPYCGPNSLVAVCEALEVTCTVDEMAKASKTDHRGATMYGLKLACESRNLVALGVKLSVQQLAELNVPAIVLIRRRHFVSVLPIPEKSSLLIVDPSSDPYYVKAEDFPRSHDWKGETLVIAKSKDDLPEYLKKGAQ